MRHRVVLALCTLALVFAGCGGDDATEGGEGAHTHDTNVSADRPSSTARISILAPAGDVQLTSGKLPVKLGLEGGRVLSEATKALKADEGHIHLSLDGKLQEMLYQLDTEVPIGPGRHVLEAEFVAGDHAPFSPRVVATREIVLS